MPAMSRLSIIGVNSTGWITELEQMSETPPQIGFVSLGCPKNLVDSEVILGLLSKEGYLLTTDPFRADMLIVNTCSFIEEATKEAIETSIQFSRFKREGRCRLLSVT